MLCKNLVQFSSAGSGKTTEIICDVLQDSVSKILIVTYTKENCSTIEKKLKKENGFIPNNVKLISWANFIMRDCVRPFHSNKCVSNIENFIFNIPRNKNGVPINLIYKSNDLRRYLSPKNWIYYDYATDFAIQCNLNNCVIERLQKNYDKIYIDEVQDLAGYDLELLELLLKSTITIKMYGDIRQATYRTQNVNKNSVYRGVKIKSKFDEWAAIKDGGGPLVIIEEKFISHRCCQSICDISDLIFSDFNKTTSDNLNASELNGVWFANDSNLENIFSTFNSSNIKILRWNKKSQLNNITGYHYYNFGECKGCTFDNVLIICTPKFLEFIKSGSVPSDDGVRTKLYIAITRARYNVIFYSKNNIENIGLQNCKKWQ